MSTVLIIAHLHTIKEKGQQSGRRKKKILFSSITTEGIIGRMHWHDSGRRLHGNLVVLCFLVLASLTVRVSSSSCKQFTREESGGEATSVWSLKPPQVDVVMALGDSITAAFGANGRWGGLHEYRGLSWSMGGDENATTLPNFIKSYNPDLQGYSIGRREGSLCWGPVCRGIHRARHDVFNAALSGAMIRNVAKDEIDYLFEQMAEHGVDMQSTWKVLTLFIGSNDICLACHLEHRLDGEEYGAYLRIILEIIRDRIPNVFVNVVELFQVSPIYELTENVTYCRHVHKMFFVECDCAFGLASEHYRSRMDTMVNAYNQKLRKVVHEFSQVKNDTFAIALHPFTRHMDIASWPLDMVSDLDCFHPSARSHALTATALWNSMLTPPNDRATSIATLDLEALCPDVDSIFYPGIKSEQPVPPAPPSSLSSPSSLRKTSTS